MVKEKLADIDYATVILQIREAKKLTQGEMADICETTQSTIQALESGRNKTPSISVVRAMVVNLGVNMSVFIYPDAKPLFLAAQKGDELTALRKKVKVLSRKITELYEEVNEEE